MNTKSKELIQLAKQYIKESRLTVAYACVGGSVGRGDADDYSDIDLTLYTNDHFIESLDDIHYRNIIIQLEVKHVSDIPQIQAIYDFPWDNRFLSEDLVIEDIDNRFMQIKQQAEAYFTSVKGRERMLEQVSKVVKDREQFALDALNENKVYTAGIAAMGAWTEAAFLYLFLLENSLATGNLIPSIQKLAGHFQAFTYASTFSEEANPPEIPLKLKAFRTHLRETQAYTFGLSEIQDQLCDSKAKRLLDQNQQFNFIWQLYGEALWLYFETANGKTFEQYVADLPDHLQKGFADIGFKPIDEKRVKLFRKLSDELLHLCAKSIK